MADSPFLWGESDHPASHRRMQDELFLLPESRLQIMPPLIEMICPEMYAARSDARKATRSATSSGWPARFMGTRFLIASASKVPSLISVVMIPGATALTVMLRLASSNASDLLAACSAPLAAE